MLPAGKSAGSMTSTVWVAGMPLSVLRRNEKVIVSLRSGTSTPARTASSGGCPGTGVMVSVRQRRWVPNRHELVAAFDIPAFAGTSRCLRQCPHDRIGIVVYRWGCSAI